MSQNVEPTQVRAEKNAFLTIVIAGMIAGTLDILAAIINANLANDTHPIKVFQYIASGIFGTDAFKGGYPMVFYGAFFHFLIATTWALLFFIIYPYFRILWKNIIVTGLVYGVFVWFVMNVIVLPFTNIPKGGGIQFPGAFIQMGILMVAIGLPIAVIVHRHFRRQ